MKAAIGSIYQERNDIDSALKVYEQAVAMLPNSTALLTDLALCQKTKGLILKGWGNLRKAIELDPSYAFAQYSLGKLYLEQELFKKSKVQFSKALELDPEDLYAYNGLGDTYYKKDRYREAILEYQNALRLLMDEHALFHKALCHRELGEVKQAIECLNQIIEMIEEEDVDDSPWLEKAENLLEIVDQ